MADSIKVLIIDDVHAGDEERLIRALREFDPEHVAVSGRTHVADLLADFADLEVRAMTGHELETVRAAYRAKALAEFVTERPIVRLPDPPSDPENSMDRPRSCAFFDRYRGDLPPTCWKGRGCAACLQKYKEKQARTGRSGFGKGKH